MKRSHVIYECGICSHYHPWGWGGDCRDNDNRYFSIGEYVAAHGISEMDVTVCSIAERVSADATD